MPLADEALAVLASALRDPSVVLRYQAKIVTVPGRTACGGAGPSRDAITDSTFYVGTVADTGASADCVRQGERDLCVIAHRFGYALVFGVAALSEVPVLGHRVTTRCVSGSAPVM